MVGEAQKLREKVFRKSENLVTRNLAGETLILPITKQVGDMDAIYTLNEVGVRVWQMLDGRMSLYHIAETISSEYAVNLDIVSKDVAELIDSLEKVQLIYATN